MADLLTTRQLPIIFAFILSLSYVVCLFAPEIFQALTLIPTEVFVTNTRVWTFITCSFIEGNVFRLVIDVFLLFLVTSPDEVKYEFTDYQFGLYLGSNVLCSTIGAFMWLMIRFFGTDSQTFMVDSSYGFGGLIMLLIMYTRRHVGDRPVLPQVPQITFHYLPSVFLVAVTALRILRLKEMTTDILFVYFSYFSSWTYLHFLYEVQGEDRHANSFTFIGMFPEAMHPVVLPLSIAAYNIFAMIGVFPKLELDRKGLQHHLRYHDTKQSVSTGDLASSTTVQQSPASSSGEDLIAERRRAKAIKLLDAKMAELSKEPEGWEDVKEDAGDLKSKV